MAKLSGGKELARINRSDPNSGALFARIIASLNHGLEQAGVAPVGQMPSTNPPNAVNVTVTGEQAHVRITDNNPTNRAVNYFTEVYADQNRTQLIHAHDHGTSRDAALVLPTMDSSGVMKAYYVSSYSQVKGGPPSAPISFSTYVTMDGTTQGDVPQSSGTGTAATNGTQPAQGFGNFPTRKATGVKREL